MKQWDKFLRAQEKELGRETVRKWLRPLKVVNFDACNLYLEAETSFQGLWFDEHVRKRAEEVLVNKNNHKIKIHLSVKSEKAPPKQEREQPEQEAPFRLIFDELPTHTTLDHLVTHSGNELASRIIGDLSSGEITLASFNPIYLCGPSGSGKSHLLIACAAALRARGVNALYVRAERFTEHVIRAIRAGEMQLFRRIYRKADVLLIDDVQALGRKAATQEELHHTFNTLHVEGKQLLFSADSAPQELRFIAPRLISRFEWGIVLPLTPPERDQLKLVIQTKTDALKLPLAPETVDFLIETFHGSAKTVMRALEALALRIHLAEHPVNPDRPLAVAVAQTHLTDLIEEERQAVLTPDKIIDAVAGHYGIKSEELLGKSQKKEISLPRQVAMYFCRSRLSLPYVKIGDIFSRDHSTVMTSVRRIEKQISGNRSELAPVVSAISKSI